MLTTIATIILALLTLLLVSLLKIYTNVPKIELKRRARQGDDFAKLLYSTAAYGASAQVLFWFLIGLSAAGFFVLLSASVPSWIALLISIALVWLGFAWLPNSRSGYIGKTAAQYLTPLFTWLLAHLYPILDRIASWFVRYGRITVHTGLYQKEDLVELLNKQKHQADNRITEAELATVKGALTYGDKLVREVMTPQRMVKSISASDSIGPHLLDELHGSGHSRFPVYQDKKDNLVGMIFARDLINAKMGGLVKDHMHKQVFYIHEDQTLNQTLQAFLKTRHHLFVVVNSFEEKVGVVTLEDVMEQILGKPVVDEFDKYDDLRAVAAMHARKEHVKNKEPDPKPEIPPEAPPEETPETPPDTSN